MRGRCAGSLHTTRRPAASWGYGVKTAEQRKQISIAFDDDPRAARTDQLARFALAAFDGAFVAWQTDPGAMLGRLLAPLPAALVAVRHALK